MQFIESPTLIKIEVKVLADKLKSFTQWQASLNGAIVSFPGFVSIEFLQGQQNSWSIVQRFIDLSSSIEWQQSDLYKNLLLELKKFAEKGSIVEAFNQEDLLFTGVTEVFISEIIPGKENLFQQWAAKIHQTEALFPGFRGVYLQKPQNNAKGHWITLLQFDSVAHLDRWLQSKERRQLLEESSLLMNSLENHRVISPYAGWFSSIIKKGEIPPNWKQAMVVLLVLFPIVMLEIKFLNPYLKNFTSAIGTFIGNALSVALLTYPMMPIALRLLDWWLLPRKNKQRTTFFGLALILFFYALEIAIFSV